MYVYFKITNFTMFVSLLNIPILFLSLEYSWSHCCDQSARKERAGEDQMQVVRVRRRHIWKDALRALSKAHFLAGVLLSVHFIGEEAADMGGPRREFLRLLMRSLATESGVLAGSDRRKVFFLQSLTCDPKGVFPCWKNGGNKPSARWTWS